MIHSMTAFARQELQDSLGSVIWEIRSVNHRYLDVVIRLPELFYHLENAIRDHLRKHLQRGKVECILRYQTNAQTQSTWSINSTLVQQLAIAHIELSKNFEQVAPVSSLDILRWPGVIQNVETDLTILNEKVLQTFEATVQDLLNMRQREGNILKQFIEQRLHLLQIETNAIEARLPELLSAYKVKLLSRIAEAKIELDAVRLEQEVVLQAQRADVSEELERLTIHVQEVHRLLQSGGPVGRRLDFLMQELHREANTLGSKAHDAEMAHRVVEMKVLIEQMREQIQNLE